LAALVDLVDFADFIADARIAADLFVVFFADFFNNDDFFADFFADLADFFIPRLTVDPPLALRAAPPFFLDFDAGRLVRLGMTSPVLREKTRAIGFRLYGRGY
jgi:hypothetical protein